VSRFDPLLGLSTTQKKAKNKKEAQQMERFQIKTTGSGSGQHSYAVCAAVAVRHDVTDYTTDYGMKSAVCRSLN